MIFFYFKFSTSGGGEGSKTENHEYLTFNRIKTCLAYSRLGFLVAMILRLPCTGWMWFDVSSETKTYGICLCIFTIVYQSWVYRTLSQHWLHYNGVADDHELITGGPYHYVRHPMYLGYGVLSLVFLLLMNNWPAALLQIVLVSMNIAEVPNEDQVLAEFFGDKFVRYHTRTPPFIPCINFPKVKLNLPSSTIADLLPSSVQ